ncbi:MAG: hypothetical protein ACTHOR_01965 [Devosia sp.]
MPTKEDEFKQRLAGVLLDLMTADDAEGRLMIGSLADQIVTHGRAESWTAFKGGLTRPAYDSLLQTFQNQGNYLARLGQQKQVYAIEVLAVALVSKTQMSDEEVSQEAPRLDQIIDEAISLYRQARTADPIIS